METFVDGNDESNSNALERIRLAIKLSKHQEASDLAREALAQDPDNPELLCDLARCEIYFDNNSEAERLARDAADQNSHDGFYVLSVALERQCRWEEAEDAIKKALDILPEEPLYHISLSRILTERGEPVQEVLDKLMSLAPQDREARLLKAHHLVWQGREEEGEEVLMGILAEDPNHPSALNNLAVLRHLQGRFLEAEQLLWQALSEYTDSHGEMTTDNLLAVARTRFPLYDWWQRIQVFLWRAVRFRNPLPNFRRQSSGEPVRTILPLVLAGCLLAFLILPGVLSSRFFFCIGTVWLGGYLTYPLANLALARQPKYRDILGRPLVRTSASLAVGWLAMLAGLFTVFYFPQIAAQPAVILTLISLTPIFFTYAMSVQTRGVKTRDFYLKLNKYQLRLLLLSAAFVLLNAFLSALSDTHQAFFETLAHLALTGITLLSVPALLISALEIFMFCVVFFPLEPFLYE